MNGLPHAAMKGSPDFAYIIVCSNLDPLYFMLLQESDAFLNVTKLGRAGFKRQCLDTPTMFVDELQRLIDIKAIPPLGEQELAPEGPGAWADKAWAAPAGAEV